MFSRATNELRRSQIFILEKCINTSMKLMINEKSAKHVPKSLLLNFVEFSHLSRFVLAQIALGINRREP